MKSITETIPTEKSKFLHSWPAENGGDPEVSEIELLPEYTPKMTIRILLMLGMLIPCLKAAEDDVPDPKLFSHPGAYFHLSAPGMKAEGKVIENRSRTTKPYVTEWVYRSGNGTGNHPDGDHTIYWHFIKSSEYGDIYVITFEDTDHGKTSVPIIYDGKKPVVLKHHEMRAEISESKTSTQAEE